MPTFARRSSVLVPLALCGGLFGCSALAAIAGPAAIEFASNLLKSGGNNFGDAYADDLKQLLMAYATPAEAANVELPEEIAVEPLTLEAQILRAGADGALTPVADGEALRDASGGEPGDRFRIAFRASESCHVYVLAIDATAWAFPLFPNAEATGESNPVTAGRTYLSPDGDGWLELDEVRGVENIYFLASRARRPDIEAMFAKIAARAAAGRPAPADIDTVEAQAVTKRGIRLTKTRVAVKTPSGSVEATSFLGVAGANDLLVTRWFMHQ